MKNSYSIAFYMAQAEGEIIKAEKLSPSKNETFNVEFFYGKEVLKTLMQAI